MAEGDPLYKAAAGGDLERVRELLCLGEDPDFRTEGQTPLMFASANGHAHVCEMLIANGANVKSVDTYKQTALHWAVRNTHIEVAQTLIAHGAETDAASTLFGETPEIIARVRGDHDMLRLVVYNKKNKTPTPQTLPAPDAPTADDVPVELPPTEAPAGDAPAGEGPGAAAEVAAAGAAEEPAAVEESAPPPVPSTKRVPPPPEREKTRPHTPPGTG